MHKISVIIPTYNRRDCLRNALESVVRQKNADFEVIVVDDGSSDGTGEMVYRDYPEVRYVWQENAGPSAARNHGIRLAQADWLAFLDSDDIWLDGKLAAQLDYIREHPEMRICQTEEIWIRNGRRVNPMNKHLKPAGSIYESCLELCLISPSSVMIHRSVLEDAGNFDETYPACEDYELWLRIASRYPVGKIEQPLITKYGGHDGQLSKEFPAMDRFRILALIKILLAKTLNPGQEAATWETLEKKISIYLTGAEKRGKKDEADQLKSLYHKPRSEDLLAELAAFFRALNPEKNQEVR